MLAVLREWLDTASELCIVLINAVALAIVVWASARAARGIVGVARLSDPTAARRELFLHYARWLTAALSFQLAADIIETAITTDWQSVGRLASVAVIRTFLEYFLGRDVDEVRARRQDAARS